MNWTMFNSWTKRFAEGDFDGLLAASLFGLIMGGLVAISVILEVGQ